MITTPCSRVDDGGTSLLDPVMVTTKHLALVLLFSPVSQEEDLRLLIYH